ncbi:MAG: Fic family protein, partial [Chloroflexota bacterium]
LGAGPLRQGQVDIVNSRTGRPVFVPASPDRVPALVDDALLQAATSDWHPAVRAAWIHVALAAIHPFRDGNGRTARVAASLAMFRGGFRRPEFCSLEEWWGTHPGEYYAAFECLGDMFDDRADVTAFLAAHLSSQLRQVLALHREEQIGRILWIGLENLCVDTHLAPRIANALYDAFHEREVTAPYYRELAEISAATATSDLQAALAAQLLTPIGERRWRKYRAGPGLYERLRAVLGLSVSPPEPATRFSIVSDIARGLQTSNTIAEGATVTIQDAQPSTRVVAWSPADAVVSVTRGTRSTNSRTT